MTPRDEPTDEYRWATPELRERLRADPAAVLRDRGINAPPDLPTDVLHQFVRVAHLLWIDGEVVPVDRFHIDPADEGLLFGRGAWESTRTVGGVPWLWPLHLDRLKQTAYLLAIDLDPDRLPSADQVRDFVARLTDQDVVVRLNVTAGRAGHPGMIWMSAAPLPLTPPYLKLRSCVNPVAKGHAYLTLKTFQYATRLRLGQMAAQDGYDSALMIDAEGNIQEAAHANVFLRLPDGWATPKADGGLLPGTVRRYLLDRAPLPVREDVIPHARLGEVREAFVTNSNAGIVPVTQVDAHPYPVGEETTFLIQWLEPPSRPGPQYRFRERGLVQR